MSSNGLDEKILKWFDKTGFPLEMATADAFSKAGFEVRQSNPYIDPESEKSREIDVIAADPDWAGAINIEYVVECKSSTNPWVVMCSKTALRLYNRVSSFAVTTESGMVAIAQRLNKLNSWPAFAREDDTGYGFRQALSDRADVGFGAAMNVLKACVAMRRESEEKEYKPLAFYIPVIVVDTPLFECRLEPDGKLALKQVARSEFLFRAHFPKTTGCCIRVVTKGDLPTWSAEAKAVADTLRDDLQDEETRVINSLDNS